MSAKQSGVVTSEALANLEHTARGNRTADNSTPFIQVKNVWQEYGDQVVLERLNLNKIGRAHV